MKIFHILKIYSPKMQNKTQKTKEKINPIINTNIANKGMHQILNNILKEERY